MIRAALESADFEVALAEDGEDGLSALERTEPDGIVTDINMPRLDGFGFIEKVREQEAYRTTPILVLSTESGPELKQRAREGGATGWIVKPFDRDKLVSVLDRLIG